MVKKITKRSVFLNNGIVRFFTRDKKRGVIVGCGLALVAAFIFVFVAACYLFYSSSADAEEKGKVIAITDIVEHPALTAVREGILETLAEKGFVEGENLTVIYESAQGNVATAQQIADSFVSKKPDVIVGIATPSAQALVGATRNIPIVFSAVTDPVGADLIPQMRKPGGNVTGVSDLSPIDKHLKLIRRITPKVRKLGVIYNAGEANSVSLVKLINELAGKHKLEIKEATVAKSSEVLQAAQSLVGKVDAIYVPTDNTVVSAFESVVRVARDAKLAIYAGDTDSVKRGALAALGFNYKDVGKQTGEIIAKVLNGKKVGSLNAEGVEITELYLNQGKADELGIKFGKKLLKEAKKVVR